MDEFVDSCKKGAVAGMEWVLRALAHVPDDKLDWTPVPTAKSALRIAAHCAVTAGNFARMISDRAIPVGDEIDVHFSKTNAAELALGTREEVESLYRQNTDAVLVALETVTPDLYEKSLDSSLGWSMPMSFLMRLPGIHGYVHTGQIDYLQTCWDDQVVHF